MRLELLLGHARWLQRKHRGALALLTVGCFLPGCLEGDPNPYALGGQGSTSSGGSSSGGGEASAGVARGSSPPGGPIEAGVSCSENSLVSTQLDFENRYSSRTLSLYWVSYDCSEIFYADIAPGGSRSQNTYAGHPWRLRHDGQLLHEYVATDAPRQSVPLP